MKTLFFITDFLKLHISRDFAYRKVPEILREIKTLWHEVLNGFCGLLSDFQNRLFRVIPRIYFIKFDFLIIFLYRGVY